LKLENISRVNKIDDSLDCISKYGLFFQSGGYVTTREERIDECATVGNAAAGRPEKESAESALLSQRERE